MERERKPAATMRLPRVDDYEAIRRMHSRIWRATYPNESAGVSRQWIDEETEQWLTPESLERSKRLFQAIVAHPETHFYRVAEDAGEPVGFIHVTLENGHYNLGGLYVDPRFHGAGVANELMSEMDKWVGSREIDLEVVTYNARAIRFYERHGFVMQNHDNELFKGKMPNRTMIRKAKEMSDEV